MTRERRWNHKGLSPGRGVTPYIRVYGYVPRGWVDFFGFLVFGWVAITSKIVFGWVAFSQIWYLGGSHFLKFGMWVGRFFTNLINKVIMSTLLHTQKSLTKVELYIVLRLIIYYTVFNYTCERLIQHISLS
jgi:hypothetical protein